MIFMESITINKQAVDDLIKIKDEFDSVVESIELMSNPEFMKSYNKAKEQIRKRDFDEWSKL